MSTPSTARHRAVVVGLGFIGAGDQVSGDAIGGQQVAHLDGTHSGALSGHSRVHLIAGSSRDRGRRDRFTQRTGVKTYEDWREMLAAERPEIVSVATYSPQHAEVTLAAAKHGAKVVYCEKPIAQQLADAERMLAACRDAGTLLVVNHNRRFNPNFRRLAKLVATGGLGELTSASLGWGSGRLGNIGTHFIDALLMIVGRRVRAVSGTLDLAGKADCRGAEFHDPGAWGVMKLDGDLMVTLDAPDFGRNPARIQINGTLGTAVVGRNVDLEMANGQHEHWTPVLDGKYSMDRAVGEIVDWLDHGTAFPYSAEESVHVLEAILAFHASHARNAAWVELPLKGEDRKLEVKSG